MNKIYLWLFYSRDFLVRNFMVSSKALIYNKQLIYLKGLNNLLYLIFRLLPFCFVKSLLYLFNIGVIYKQDSIYNITNIQHNHIIPIISSFLFIKDDNEINFISKIKYYNGNIPLHFIIYENNLKEYNKIKIKYFNKGKLIDKIFNINDFINLPIYKIFEN
jgi:hypothetical protein